MLNSSKFFSILILIICLLIINVIDFDYSQTPPKIAVYFVSFFLLFWYYKSNLSIKNIILLNPIIIFSSFLFALTFLEFIFDQTFYEDNVGAIESVRATSLVILVMIILTLFSPPIKLVHLNIYPKKSTLYLFLASCLLYYIRLLIYSDFDYSVFINNFFLERFSRVDIREREGGFSDVINTLSDSQFFATLFFACAMFLKAKKCFQKIFCFLIYLPILIQSITSGTRSLFIVHISILILMYFLLSKSKDFERIKELCIIFLVFTVTITFFPLMLNYRSTGSFTLVQNTSSSFGGSLFFIDLNLFSLSQIVSSVSLMGENNFYTLFISITKVIPRFLWASKPVQTNVTAVDITDLSGATTVTSTFIGDAYLDAGFMGVIVYLSIYILFFRYLSRYWVSKYIQRSLPFYLTLLLTLLISVRSFEAISIGIFFAFSFSFLIRIFPSLDPFFYHFEK